MRKFFSKITLCLISALCLTVFIACNGVEFKINFIVDGEVYTTVNTGGGELIKMPDNPEKDEYTFDGWFWDKDTWEKPFTANSLLDAPLSSDMSVYAKWKSNHNYIEKITKEPTCTEKGEKTFTCECGDSYTEEINALGHIFTNYVSDNNATYEQDGTKTAVCKRGCGATDTITDVGSKLPEIEEFFTKQVDNSYYGKVYNTTTNFDFTDKIDYDCEYSVCTDTACTKPLTDNKTSLKVGDNIFYILYDNGQKTTATVHRRLIYTVTFNSAGGTAVSSQNIEEDRHATAPKNPMRVGYTFNAWDRNFNEPIIENTTITALWNANTNTPYKIEYYLQNLEDDNYTLQESDTEYLTGTTDTTVAAEIKIYEHFTIINNNVSGNINGDGSTIIKVYYNLDKFNVNISADSNISCTTYKGKYKYGTIIPEITATLNIGYDWQGWYSSDGDLITSNFTIPSFTVDKEIYYLATCAVKDEMANFNFTSTTEACTITGIKDKTVTEIIVPNYVTAINQGAFSGCLSLESITIPFVGGSRKTASDTYQYSFGYIFGTSKFTGSTSTTQYYYGSSTSSTTYDVYYIPSSLKTVTVTGGNFLYGAFYNCTSLTSITIPDSVTNIESYAFYGCNSLEYNGYGNGYYLGNNDNKHLVFVKAVNTSITSCEISDKTRFIINNAFRNCTSLTSITIPDSVTSIGESAFYYCMSLTSVYYTGTIDSWCEINFYSYDDNPLYYAHNLYINNELVTEVNITTATKINTYAFYNCTSLESITIPNSVTSIGNRAFSGCACEIVWGNNLSITTIGSQAFRDYKGTNITIPNSVTSIGRCAFSGCACEIVWGDNPSITTIDSSAFYGYKGMSITIPDSVTSIGGSAFEGCTSLTSITIPDRITSIGARAFYNCSSLTSITIPDSVTSIGNEAFKDCTSLTKVYYTGAIDDWVSKIVGLYSLMNYGSSNKNLYINGNLVTEANITTATEIKGYSFKNCSSLTSITIGNSVTSIEYAAFYNCTSLTSIIIPDSVTRIEGNAFSNCSILTSINFNGTKKQWQAISKGINWAYNVPSSCVVHCTDGDINI